MQITPAMVALWKRGQEILATKAEQKWEEEGGRRREFLDLAVELHELLDRRPWEVDVFYVDAMKPSDDQDQGDWVGAAAAHPVLAVLEGENKQTGIVLLAGNAPISRIPNTASTASPALMLDLERRLRAVAPLDPRTADRVHTLNLTGRMAGYDWSINNVVWTKQTPPLPVAGERVELIFINQTPMPHPMHLHGHQFQVVEIDGQRFSGAVRDTRGW